MKQFISLTRFILFPFIPAFFISVYAYGQDDPLKKFRFKNEGQSVLSVPFTMINNLIVMELRVNNLEGLNFILDSGLTTTLLTSLETDQEIILDYAREVELTGLGRGEPVKAVHSFGNEIHIDEIIGKNQDIYILTENYFNLSERFGMPINGIIGHSIFSSFIIEIDYNRKIIRFHDPEKFKFARRHRKFTELPLDIINTKSYIDIQITYEDGNSSGIKVLFDTGASHSLWVEPKSINNFSWPEQTHPSFLGYGLNGEVFGEIFRIGSVDIAGFTLNNPLISLPDSASLSFATGMDFRNGSMGAELIKRFNIIVDYKNKVLKIRPNRYFKESFRQNLSGIGIIAPLVTFPLYVAENVRYGSPAWEAGVRPGDEISAINGISTSKMELFDINRILHSRPGRRITLKLLREGEPIRTSFRLEEFI